MRLHAILSLLVLLFAAVVVDAAKQTPSQPDGGRPRRVQEIWGVPAPILARRPPSENPIVRQLECNAYYEWCREQYVSFSVFQALVPISNSNERNKTLPLNDYCFQRIQRI